jgi:hypothetical protein
MKKRASRTSDGQNSSVRSISGKAMVTKRIKLMMINASRSTRSVPIHWDRRQEHRPLANFITPTA